MKRKARERKRLVKDKQRKAIRKKHFGRLDMFNISEFMKAPQVDDTRVVQRGTEEFKIRRLNGLERLRFNDLNTLYERTVYVLGHALLSGSNDAPIGEENAAKFIERYSTLADNLFSDIFEFTQEHLKSEGEVWELAKKNMTLDNGTNTKS